MRVLDIGTGTGLLAMMAAECGADSVHACEVSMIHYSVFQLSHNFKEGFQV